VLGSDRVVTGFVAPRPGPHGGDGARLAAALGIDPDEVLDLSVSLNPCAPDVAPLVVAHARVVDRYPDADAATCALAQPSASRTPTSRSAYASPVSGEVG